MHDTAHGRNPATVAHATRSQPLRPQHSTKVAAQRSAGHISTAAQTVSANHKVQHDGLGRWHQPALNLRRGFARPAAVAGILVRVAHLAVNHARLGLVVDLESHEGVGHDGSEHVDQHVALHILHPSPPLHTPPTRTAKQDQHAQPPRLAPVRTPMSALCGHLERTTHPVTVTVAAARCTHWGRQAA